MMLRLWMLAHCSSECHHCCTPAVTNTPTRLTSSCRMTSPGSDSTHPPAWYITATELCVVLCVKFCRVFSKSWQKLCRSFCKCFCCRSFQPVNRNIVGRVQSLQATVIKFAYLTLVTIYDTVWTIPCPHLPEDARPHLCRFAETLTSRPETLASTETV